MKISIQSDSTKMTEHIGQVLGKWARPGTVFALDGDLGAGKTVLTRGIATGMGINDVVRSPTYTILIEHKNVGAGPDLYHFDTYRLDGEDDFIASGLDEYLYQNAVCVIEWSEKIDSILPEQTVRINIRGVDMYREITLITPSYFSKENKILKVALSSFLLK